MTSMTKTMHWVKSNLAIVACVVFSFASLCVVAVVTLFLRGTVTGSVEKLVKDQSGKAQVLLTQTKVKLPGYEPGSEMTSMQVVANPQLIDAMNQINSLFSKTGTDMRDLARKLNGGAHEKTCIIPDGGLDVFNLPKVRQAYDKSFAAALWHPQFTPATAELTDEVRKSLAIKPLLAGMPYSLKSLQEISDASVKTSLKARVVSKMSELNAKSQTEVETLARNAVLQAMRTRAESIGIYADPDPGSPGYPFAGLVRDWGRAGTLPSAELAYESQADLWILRDMMEALSRANHIGEDGYSVLKAPVKRLLRLQVSRDGYVGLHTMGMVVGSSTAGASLARLSMPAGITLKDDKSPQVENFFVAPTGRISNAVYDVKHAKLEVLVDVSRLPELLAAIDSVNAMTVVGVSLEDVDEYKELREGGYFYGPCDVVKATLVVETLWMRSWTVPKMPEATRKYLGISVAP